MDAAAISNRDNINALVDARELMAGRFPDNCLGAVGLRGSRRFRCRS